MTDSLARVGSLVTDGFERPSSEWLRSAQRQKLLLALVWARRVLERESPSLVRASGFDLCYATLHRLGPEGQERAAREPWLGRWVSIMMRLLARGMHRTVPDAVAPHLQAFASVPLAAALSSDAEVSLDALFDASATLALPGCHAVLVGPLELAGRRARCSTMRGRRLSLDIAGKRVELSLSPTHQSPLVEVGCHDVRVRLLPVAATFLELNDTDGLLRTGHEYAFAALRGADEARRWIETVEQAVDLLSSVVPGYAEEVRTTMRVLVPLVAPNPATNVSSSSHDAFGMMQTSDATADPLVMAETIVHECHHNKLNALFDLEPLVDEAADAPRLFSPWRADPRPPSGLLHGAFAFNAVSAFLAALAQSAPPGSRRSSYQAAAERRRLESLRALDELDACNELTLTGLTIAQTLRDRLEASRPFSVSQSVRAGFEAETDARHAIWSSRYGEGTHGTSPWMDAWVAAGGTLRRERPRECFEVRGAAYAELAADLGAVDGVRVNHLALARASCDPTLDLLGRMSVNDPERFSRIAKLVAAMPPATPFDALIAGHVAYTRGAHAVAADHYAACLDVAPENVDVWLAFTFTLRQLRLPEADVFLFHPRRVVSIAAAIVFPGGGITVGLAASAPFSHGSRAADYVRLLAWLREEPCRV